MNHTDTDDGMYCPGRSRCTEVKRLRAEVRRIKGWLRWLRATKIQDGREQPGWVEWAAIQALSGEPAPRRQK